MTIIIVIFLSFFHLIVCTCLGLILFVWLVLSKQMRMATDYFKSVWELLSVIRYVQTNF